MSAALTRASDDTHLAPLSPRRIGCSDVEANTRRKAMSRCLVLLLACVAAPTVVAKHQRTAQERLAQIWGWETGSVKVQHRAPKKEVQHRALWVSVAAAPTPTPHDGQ